jgi:hypothetical protein
MFQMGSPKQPHGVQGGPLADSPNRWTEWGPKLQAEAGRQAEDKRTPQVVQE